VLRSCSELVGWVDQHNLHVADPVHGDRDRDGELLQHENQVLVKISPRDYVLADGSTVLVDPALPLPAEVVADVKAKAAPSVALAIQYRDGDELGSPQQYTAEGTHKLLNETSVLTGTTIAIVSRTASVIPGSRRYETI
jgi:hypothetical protein